MTVWWWFAEWTCIGKLLQIQFARVQFLIDNGDRGGGGDGWPANNLRGQRIGHNKLWLYVYYRRLGVLLSPPIQVIIMNRRSAWATFMEGPFAPRQ